MLQGLQTFTWTRKEREGRQGSQKGRGRVGDAWSAGKRMLTCAVDLYLNDGENYNDSVYLMFL